jgi:hypothetical protein
MQLAELLSQDNHKIRLKLEKYFARATGVKVSKTQRKVHHLLPSLLSSAFYDKVEYTNASLY